MTRRVRKSGVDERSQEFSACPGDVMVIEAKLGGELVQLAALIGGESQVRDRTGEEIDIRGDVGLDVETAGELCQVRAGAWTSAWPSRRPVHLLVGRGGRRSQSYSGSRFRN